MDDDLKIVLAIVGIVCITVLEVCAIVTGLNGTTFATVLATITGIVTITVGEKVKETLSGLMGKKDDEPSSTN